VPLSSMRRAIAEHMLAARTTIPHGLVVAEADLTDLVAWREATKAQFEQREGARLTLTVCFVAALGRALAQAGHRPVDLGVAVALERGLIVPIIRGADALGLDETARELTDLAGRTRAGRLAPADLQGGLMTVTNVGTFGNLLAAPIIPLGQLGILGPGLVEQRPLPAGNGSFRIGWRCLLSLVVDRRAIDDFAADRLLGAVVEQLDTLPAE
jgi:pyruvate/2-oxoglutarate dehydrogenase complex dihydrolipoamide acyltransferase (E2) component